MSMQQVCISGGMQAGWVGFCRKINKSKNSLRCDTTYCRRHIALCTKRISYISTRSTLIPQGSVASSRTVCKIKLTQENCSPNIKSTLVQSYPTKKEIKRNIMALGTRIKQAFEHTTQPNVHWKRPMILL